MERMEIHDVILIKPKVFNYNRGYFLKTYSFPQFSMLNIDFKVIQENQSCSKRNNLLSYIHKMLNSIH
ncbi:MAG: dTDP-4-dehydrorhamnose 3,5-epimerase family protein [Nanopusillaceae archaeon]